MNRKVTIVMYHYVRDLKNSEYPRIKGLDVSLFEKQLQYISENYHVIRMEDLLAACESGNEELIPENALLLTFDDGYIDHYEEVFPRLKKFGLQGSFFPNAKAVKEHALLDVNKIHFILATAPIEALVADVFSMMDDYRTTGVELRSNEDLYQELAVPNRWDKAEVIFVKRLLQNYLPEEIRGEISSKLFEKYVGMDEVSFAKRLYMNRAQIAKMKADGMFFGLHGYDHYWLSKLSWEEMHRDIEKALEYFGDIVDRENWVMNFPYGDYSDAVLAYIREKGCKIGLSVEARVADLNSDDFLALPRLDTNDISKQMNFQKK